MKKIMFNDRYGLTDAVLTGRKTMTRRIVPPIEIDWNRRGRVTLPVSGFKHGLLWMDCSEFLPGSGPFDYVAPQKYQPRYGKGDVVAVAQRYKDVIRIAYCDESVWQFLVEKDLMQSGGAIDTRLCTSAGYDNKMFVRADLMPHRIRITDIKVERLQDISDEDCLKEGVMKGSFDGWYVPGIGRTSRKGCMRPIAQTADGKPYYGDRYRDFTFDTPRNAFAALIDRISGRGTWHSNPWVVAYEFELIKKED